jgi:dTDP-4-dehydrorhamnose 3,5-epimerase
MKVTTTNLSGVLIIEPKVFGDARGFFFESYHAQKYQTIGIELPFVQDNMSRSSKGVLRGLHYQLKHPQGKLVSVISGEVFDVVVDIRVGSPTFGKWFGLILNDKEHKQLYVPPGFAHGFCVLSEEVNFHYKCTDYYRPEDEQGILWNDPTIGIKWPLDIEPNLSAKDQKYPCLADIPQDLLPAFHSREGGNL